MHDRVTGIWGPVKGKCTYNLLPLKKNVKNHNDHKVVTEDFFCNKHSCSQHCKAIFESFICIHRKFHGLQYLVQ